MALDPGPSVSSSSGPIGHPASPPVQHLPIDKVFPIQIGSEVFRISGNALNSDSPSYFTQFFITNSGPSLKTLYIDRDPAIFKDIVRHLQGYLVAPKNEEHFVYLYSDAIYYRLPRLRARLFRDFYVKIGDTSFQIPKELFNEVKQKGDSKNFFSMGFGSAMASPFPDDKMFPQLNMENFDAEKQLRPPYMVPPKLSRSSSNFEEIVKYMQGYELEIRSDVHRRNLIKDSRFYNLRHLSEVLVPAKLFHNPFRGNAEELLLNITHFRANNARIGWVEGQPFGWMEYKRSHDVDKTAKDLLIQIDDDGLIVGGGKVMLINRQQLNAVKLLKESAESKKTETHPGRYLGGAQELAIRIEIPVECFIMCDGNECSGLFEEKHLPTVPPTENGDVTSENGDGGSAIKKRKLSESAEGRSVMATTAQGAGSQVPRFWTLKRSIWRVKVKEQPPPPSSGGGPSHPPGQPVAGGKRVMILVAVKLEGWTDEKEFAKEIPWL